MPRQREGLFKDVFLKQLRTIPFSWWEKIQQVSIRGTPDVIGVVRGNFVAIELKTNCGIVSPIQYLKLDLIKQAGGIAEVVSPANAEEILKILRNETDF